ncbi:protein of unknown function [Cyclobacterium lianum]|uniref:DUF4249 domain-containing protein n=1 Tax=Cyclobacterium lianum TaxID=388280 RepID=A0A1M7MP05_9BACT|nr:DUF4249 domain-containing protein [Cyclobacterium lianum]SHM92782.1 protein of unknown function [Cyclobacterium lianum]
MAISGNITLFYIIGILVLCNLGCREPFSPEISDFDQNILVVEGYIEVGGGTTQIHLSSTSSLYAGGDAGFVVPQAELTIRGEREGSWPLQQVGYGAYEVSDYLPEDQSYILSINLANGDSYRTDPISPMRSPEFDLSFTKEAGDVQVYANTRGDAQNQYFLWVFEETWMYRTPHISYYNYDETRGGMVMIDREDLTYLCWNFNRSRRIILESSARYEDNRIFQKELLTIDSLSEKLGIRYRINARQYVLDREAYVFWEGLRRNSDDIGSIFSPLPSAVSSNIYHTQNADIPVIGYISAGLSREKEMYIDREAVSPWRTVIADYQGCQIDTVSVAEYEEKFGRGNYVPLYEDCETFPCSGYFASTAGCTDCRLRGGTTTRPEDWQDD